MLRTREQYRESLFKMKPNIHMGGKKVGRDDSRLTPGINVLSTTFELTQNPGWKNLSTILSPIIGEEISRWAHLPQNPYDLIQKQKLIRMTSRRVGGCIQRCTGNDALNALAICTKEIDLAKGTHYFDRFLDYLYFYQKNDLDACCAQTDSKGDRLKRPSQQSNPDAYVHVVEEQREGIIISGIKMSITHAAYADEIIVIPTRALKEDNRDYAVAFAIPADWEGISLITHPIGSKSSGRLDCPPLCKYGVADSVIVFDHVFIPKERVFMCGEWEFGRRMALLFADSHRYSYCGCKPAFSDVLCGAASLAAEANNIETVPHIRQKIFEFAGIAEFAYAAGIAAALYGELTSAGVFFPNIKYASIGKRLTGRLIYREYNLLTDIAGGIAATLPYPEDFAAEETRQSLEKIIVRNTNISLEDSRKIWSFIEYVSTSPMTAWYEFSGVHGGGSPVMETLALTQDYDYEMRKKLAKYLAGIDEDFDDFSDLWDEPSFGESLTENKKEEFIMKIAKNHSEN
jgi:aromatic ring hydroxylase